MKLIRHTVFNLLGLGLPLVVGLATIPALIHALGTARFGLLTLIWAVVSYFGLFDLGLGRALTQQLAIAFTTEENHEVGPLVATASGILAILGLAGGAVMALGGEFGVGQVHEVPNVQEALLAVYAMALAMPSIVLTSGFKGILEARHAFGVLNVIRVPMGLFTFLGPLAVVTYGQPRLDWIAWTLAAGRIVGCLVHAYYAWKSLPLNSGPLTPTRRLVRPLCVSGGWLTVTNVVGPLMGYVDRFVIGAVVSASAVAYYVTPQEMVTKLWIVPGALTAVLFPTFAAHMTKQDGHTRLLFKRALMGLAAVLFPITAVLAIFAREILSIWINPAFAAHSYIVLQIFSAGIFVNCLSHVPYTLIQSSGKAWITAWIHLIQLPIFLATLWLLSTNYGIIGAALAWLCRIILDAILMFLVNGQLLRDFDPPPLVNGLTIDYK